MLISIYFSKTNLNVNLIPFEDGVNIGSDADIVSQTVLFENISVDSKLY